MFVFDLQELLGRGQEEGWLSAYLKNPDSFYLSRDRLPATFFPLLEFLFRGTFPATIELPTSQIPRYMSSYQNLTDFNRFLGISASLTAQEINASQLGREIGISPQTARRWLDLLSYTYQWFELFP